MAYKTRNKNFKFKVALEATKEQDTMSTLSSKHGIASSQISKWKTFARVWGGFI